MANAIELITKYSSKAWDKVYKAEAISSILDGDKDLIKFTGVKTVKIAKFASSGLSDYHRANNEVTGNFGGDGHSTGKTGGYGYQQGDASLTWEEFTIKCDRGVQLRIELFDDEETDGLAVAAATTEVSRTKVVPEVDAYVFSKLVEYAGTVEPQDIKLGTTLGVTGEGQPLYELNKAFLALADAEVPENDQVIFCSNSFYNALRNTNEIVKTLRQTEYGDNVKFTVGEYEGREIIAVPATRFNTMIDCIGHSNGYGWKEGSKRINFIVCAKSAVYHVTKYDKVRVFSPSVVQDFDGYKVNIRVYHDVFVPDNKRIAIYASIAKTEGAATSPSGVIFNYDAENKMLKGVSVLPGDTLVDGFYADTTARAVGSAYEANVAIYSPLSLGTGNYYLHAIKGGKVIAVSKETFPVSA